ncbi:unnamed protein product [Staurois parvus]|uniref:Uncharacterized protein n=1 Tax=Staurois parvus TaxID=386267 RepID=A0ABN9DB18_9NEOB|nr:unnamed protein product [Staurois parvus]
MLIKSTDTVLMTLGRKGVNIWGNQRVNCALSAVLLCVLCVFYLENMLLYISLLCREIYSSMLLLAGERPVLFTHRSLPRQ